MTDHEADESFMTDGEFFDSLIPGLKEKARRIVHEKQLNKMDELLLRVRYFLSQHYNIPMKSKVFDDYSPEDLYLEYFIIQECKKAEKDTNSTAEQKHEETVSAINDNKDSLKSLFNEFRNPPQQQQADECDLFSDEEQSEYIQSITDGDGFF
jgi:hypothetical protein